MYSRIRLLTTILSLFVLTGIFSIGCTTRSNTDSNVDSLTSIGSQANSNSTDICMVTEPERLKPPEDTAVQGSPVYGHYFTNADQSILASAWWTEQEYYYLTASEKGIKTGWFRPAGATLEITGQRIDAEAPPLETSVPCCYPTRFQATGLTFPTEGCWEVTAKAADSELSFTVWVEP